MRRRFLFLQGPVGPFFRMLGATLRREGHTVYRVNLSGADVFDWPRGDVFRGKGDAWPAYIRQYAASRDITDLVIFGDCRMWHRLAVQSLRDWKMSLRVHVMEEGYIRPDWITLEQDGVNGHSPLHALRGRFADAAEATKAPPEPLPSGESAVAMGFRATLSYLSMFLATPLFPHYVHHRPLRSHEEAGAWLKKLVARRAARRKALAQQAVLLESAKPYFLILLQIDADKQVQEHSPIHSMLELLDSVLPSFARYAPADAGLVVKAHPLDPESRLQGAHTAMLARKLRVADRVTFIDGGELGALISHSRGCVTINSTSGISALHRGKPLHVLGKAVYCGPGLTHQGSIDEFWTTDYRPEAGQYEAFRRVVVARSQINGNFYTKQGMRMAIAEVARRLARSPAMREEQLPSSQMDCISQKEVVSA